MKQSRWIPHSPFGLLNRCSEGIGRNRSRLAGLLSRRNTASHRCYYKTQGAPPLSAAVISRNSPSASLQKSAKKQETPDEVSPKKQFYTSYGGIIRIRLRVEVKMTSSQPAIQAPLFLLYYYTASFVRLQVFLSDGGSSCRCVTVRFEPAERRFLLSCSLHQTRFILSSASFCRQILSSMEILTRLDYLGTF